MGICTSIPDHMTYLNILITCATGEDDEDKAAALDLDLHLQRAGQLNVK